ncbi:MAG: DUF1801 domain-containing protein [Erysipelotrichaceae bacterium]
MNAIETYLSTLEPAKQEVLQMLRTHLRTHLPTMLEEQIQYGMISYVIPLTLYPKGYLDDPTVPLPFVAIAAQKQHIALYHMGVMAKPSLLEAFEAQYRQRNLGKLDHGKSCLRFHNPAKIPYDLIIDLCHAMEIEEYIALYEASRTHKTKGTPHAKPHKQKN